MKKNLMNPIFEKYNLGIITAEPEAVEGGLIHRMWKVDTAENSYAVKQLNPLIINKPGLPDDYVRTEIIARTFAEHNIPAVAALFFDDSPLIKLDDAIIMIYPWIEGFNSGLWRGRHCQMSVNWPDFGTNSRFGFEHGKSSAQGLPHYLPG